MPRRKRHFVYCKAGLHRLPPPYTTKLRTEGMKRQGRWIGDRGVVYVARQCMECLRLKRSKQHDSRHRR